MADLLWSPAVGTSPAPASIGPVEAGGVPATVAQATQMLVESPHPQDWAKRRAACAYLLKTLDPPLDHRSEWAALWEKLESAPPPASAWECWRPDGAPPAGGLFGAYQNRLSGLRLLQVQSTAERLRPILQKNDYPAYRAALPLHTELNGPLGLLVTLQPLARVGQDDLIPYPLWWQILLNQSDLEALRAGSRLARGKTPELHHRWENGVCVCWTAGPDGKDEGGILEASREEIPESPAVGDWIYRFR